MNKINHSEINRSEFLRLTSLGTAAAFLPTSWATASLQQQNNARPDIDYRFEGTPKGLRPYLQSPRPNSMWVSWWSDSDEKTIVEFGESKDKLDNRVEGRVDKAAKNYHYHFVQLTGLQPKTWYYYRAKTENMTSEVFRFRTPEKLGSASGKYRVVVIGDNQVIDPKQRRYERLVERAKKKVEDLYRVPIEEAIDLVVMVGDQVDVGTLEHYRHLHFKYCGWISPSVPIMTSIGNHETYKDAGLANYKRFFFYDKLSCAGVKSPHPEIYNAYQLANIAFVHTSSEHGNDRQTQWVKKLSEAVQKDKTIDWMISICHRPYQAEQYIGDISTWLRNTAMEILSQTEKHVLNIGGHHHLYARGQTRDWPVYHIISGGSSWDQAWGMSREQDYDDVQKTISNWAWQLVEFDLDERTMDVRCFAEANPKFDNKRKWSYNSRQIDQFHRKRGLSKPKRPKLKNKASETVSLPYRLRSTPFETTTQEKLSSTQFQLSADKEFKKVVFDKIINAENIYGDTGTPDYVPKNINSKVDLLEFEIPKDSLPNKAFFARVRHRDTNVLWSEWSDIFSFQVSGSTNTGITSVRLKKDSFTVGEDIEVIFENAPSNPQDWIGIYRDGNTPGKQSSQSWKYVDQRNGTVTLDKNLPAGHYFVCLFANNGYSELTKRIRFKVVKKK